MKVLLDHPFPFLLAHGGFQIQIEQTHAALNRIGIETEYLQWWNPAQRGDIIHYFGRPDTSYLQQARQKGYKVAFAELLGGLSIRPAWARKMQKAAIAASRSLLPPVATRRFDWQTYLAADACIAVTPWEAHLMQDVFGAPADKIHIIPNGVENDFFQSAPETRGQWLVVVASIFPVKRILETAQAAVLAQTPCWFIGRPLSETDAYYRTFLDLQQRHQQWIRYDGAIASRPKLAQALRQARGFVLLSHWESLSLSTLEAAACECRVLLSDQPWAHGAIGENARYCPIAPPAHTAPYLRKFYDQCSTLLPPPKPLTWDSVAQKLKIVYERLLSTSA